MVLPLVLILTCHVLVASSRTATLADVASWRQMLREQAEADAAAAWIATPEDAGGDELPDRDYTGLSTTKRGLSLISRWKPFRESLGRLPARARIFPVSPDMEFISAETRGIVRPIGQPLRWGRR